MSKKTKSAISLFKNLVNTGSNLNAIRNSMYDAFEIDSKNTVKWFEELSTQNKHPGWYNIENSLLDLLPKITEVNTKSGLKIFNNLLKPEFETVPAFLPFEKPTKRVKQNRHDFWQANQIIVKLFNIAPKEFLKATFELVLEYHDIPRRFKNKQIQDVYSTIWYYDDSHNEEISLLRSIEHESWQWASRDDPRITEIIQYLEKIPNSLALKILTNILLCKPKKYRKKLFELAITKLVFVDDCLHLFPKVLNSIKYYLSKSQIIELNNLVFMEKYPIEIVEQRKIGYQKFIAQSIPQKCRMGKIKNWLKNEAKDVTPTELMERPMVTSSYEKSKKSPRERFSELNLKDQETELTRSIQMISKIKTKDDKLDFLQNISVYINKKKSKVKKKFVLLLEPIVWELCQDPDPKEENLPDDGQIKHSLISYPTVRAYAAGNLLPLMWHNPTPKTLNLILKMAEDKHSFVRENVCRSLRYLAIADYDKSFELAKKFTQDNQRVNFFLADYMNFNVLRHPDDILCICETMVKNYVKTPDSSKYVQIMDYVTSLIVQLALKFENKKFEKLFNELLNNDTFDYEIKHQIIFTCKKDDILFKTSLKKKILGIYLKLLDSKNDKVWFDVEFFLLYTLVKNKKSFWPEIKPILSKLSKTKYNIDVKSYRDFYLISYIEEFWKEFPCEACDFIFNLYFSNPKLYHGYHRGRDTIELIEKLYKSQSVIDKNQKNIMDVLLEFIKAGWPEASMILKKLESNN